MYCTLTDMIGRFGADELIQLANRLPVHVPDAALEELAEGGDLSGYAAEVAEAAERVADAVDEAIADARAEIDPYLEARYRLPFASVPRVISRIAIEVARYVLHGDTATEAVQRRYRDQIALLRRIASGEVSLGLTASDERTPAQGGVATMGGKPVMTSNLLKGYTG